jgi:hypothetical protein
MHQGEEPAPQELFPIDPQAPGESLEPHMLLVRRPPLPSGGFGYSGRGLHTGFGGAQGRPVSVQRILQGDASGPGLPVPMAPRAASVRVWHLSSCWRGPRMGRPPPEVDHVAYPPSWELPF